MPDDPIAQMPCVKPTKAATHDTWFRDQVRATRQRLATDGKLTEYDAVFAGLRAYAFRLDPER